MKIEYREAKDYRVISANGVWGGLAPHNQIRMAFYSEFVAPPESEIYEQKDKDLVKVNQDEEGTRHVIREMQVGVTIPVSLVPNLIEWLKDKYEQYEALSERDKG